MWICFENSNRGTFRARRGLARSQTALLKLINDALGLSPFDATLRINDRGKSRLLSFHAYRANLHDQPQPTSRLFAGTRCFAKPGTQDDQSPLALDCMAPSIAQMTTFKLWWSLLWRMTAVLLALSFVPQPVAQVLLLLGVDAVAGFKFRPSVVWWLTAALFWTVGAVSPRLVRLFLWGERLSLANPQWLIFSRGTAIFFVLLGFVNLVVASAGSESAWVKFKLFWPYPLFVIALVPLADQIRRGRMESNL